MLSLVSTLAVCLTLLTACAAEHKTVILIGATGDLAKKYLWQSLFDVYQRDTDRGHTFMYFGAARMPAANGRKELQAILQRHVRCAGVNDSPNCPTLLEKFRAAPVYLQLKTDEDFSTLAKEIALVNKVKQQVEDGRLFYLSIPPSAYAGVAESIDRYCRPKMPGQWLRVVLEKPFGSSHRSAVDLMGRLGHFLREDEMYRIDHYLGKDTIAALLPFRMRNRMVYEPLLHHEHVDRVEIVMKEAPPHPHPTRTGY